MTGRPSPCSSLHDVLYALPEGHDGEIVDRHLYVRPRPPPLLALAAATLRGELHASFARVTGDVERWRFVHEPAVHFVPKVELTVPSIAGWRLERMPVVPDTDFFELLPDWLCEIVSPFTVHHARHVKLPLNTGLRDRDTFHRPSRDR